MPHLSITRQYPSTVSLDVRRLCVPGEEHALELARTVQILNIIQVTTSVCTEGGSMLPNLRKANYFFRSFLLKNPKSFDVLLIALLACV